MKQEMVIYHGSQQIVEVPKFGIGKKYYDYGQGFYCTESNELAKEWACPVKNDGYSNKYHLFLGGLNVMNLTKGEFNILNRLAVLLTHRKFNISSPIGNNASEFILHRFVPETANIDVMIGYRADDSYFSFAEDFANNTISLRDLNMAMKLGIPGEQVVLLSEHSFKHIEFVGYKIADYREYYFKRAERDQDDIFVPDIIREDMKNDDTRLQSVISK